MKLVSLQEVLHRKAERQARIDSLEYHAAGHCVHLGQLSPGCHQCFVPDAFSHNFHLGEICNAHCSYCFGTGKNLDNPPKQNRLTHKAFLMQRALSADLSGIIPTISFTGGGEPLLNLDSITYYMDFYRGIEEYLDKKPWYYLYTNGLVADEETILKLKAMGFDEIRFHLGASDFSERVYRNIATAARHMDVITVETPAWPLHRAKLFEMLPRLEALGVKHLNLGEIQITPHNRATIESKLPDAEIYQCFMIHLYDGGLVYDLMEEVLARGYSYSVLDCSSLVKAIQQTPGEWHMHEPINGLCVGYSYEKVT
jgi:pyruvate formate-lyase activating enzyme-like uncharacterized protein